MTTTTQHSTVPTIDTNPFSLEVLADPLPFQERLRESGPLTFLTRWGFYGIAQHDHVREALVDWQRYESSAGVGLSNYHQDPPWRPPSVLLEADPPAHDAPRRVLGRILNPRSLRALRDRWLTEAERLVDEVLAGGNVVDGVTSLAQAFPLRVFPDAVGLREEGRENLLPYGDHMFNAFGPRNELVVAGDEERPRLLRWINEQTERSVLADDGLGAQIFQAADRGDILHGQASALIRTLLSAGIDTTVGGIAASLYGLATHPEAWQMLRENPSLVRVAFDEAVRWDSPLQNFFRTTTTEVEVGGHTVPAGSKVMLFLGAANRDPRRWVDPSVYDLTRDPSGHVGFGMGIHQCVGQHVARLEVEALLLALLPRVRSLEVAGPVRRHLNNTLRAWDSLPLRLHPSGR